MRRAIVGVLVLVVTFAVIFYVRREPPRPLAAILGYDFQVGREATYDISLVVKTTVGSGAHRTTSVMTVVVPSHAKVLSIDKANVATLRISLDRPTIRVDGQPVAQSLQVTTAIVRLSPNGHVESVSFPGVRHAISITAQGKNGSVRVGTATVQGATDPLQGVLLLAQGSLPALPSGLIKLGDKWSRPWVLSAPYMLQEAAIGNSTLDGFEQKNALYVARVSTHATVPIDVLTYHPGGVPLHVTGTQSLHMIGYFVPGRGLLSTMGDGQMNITQTVSSGSSTVSSGHLTVRMPPVHSTTVLSFMATLRQP